MMTISESQYSSNKRSSIHKINNQIVHQDNSRDVQQSRNSSSALITKRGFKPSDMFDPQKKEFLTNLSYKLFPVSWNDGELSRDVSPIEYLHNPTEDLENKPAVLVGEKEVDLNKIFTPAPDADEHIIKKNKNSFSSSAFYVPGIHPTVKDQMELARAISRSLSDSSNQMSKGQSMYVNRKKRSVKWVHEGKGRNTSNTCATPTPSSSHDTPYRPPNHSSYKNPSPTPKYLNSYPLKSALKSPSSAHNNLPKLEPFPTIPSVTIDPLPVISYGSSPSYNGSTRITDAYSRSPKMWGSKNYNTAPRGWGHVQDYYRPVTFDDCGKCHHSMPFTDY